MKMAIPKQIHQQWTKEEEKTLYELHKNLKKTDLKADKLQEVSKLIGRTYQAVSRHYYHMLKYDVFHKYENTHDIKPITTSRSINQDIVTKTQPDTVKVVDNFSVFWQKHKLDVLKFEMKRRLKKGYSYKQMMINLGKVFGLSVATISIRIRDLRKENKVENWEDFYHLLQQDKVVSNIKTREYKKNTKSKKGKTPLTLKQNIFSKKTYQPEVFEVKAVVEPKVIEQPKVFETQTVEQTVVEEKLDVQIGQVVEEKMSLFGLIKKTYLTYRMNKLEKEVEKIKSKLDM